MFQALLNFQILSWSLPHTTVFTLHFMIYKQTVDTYTKKTAMFCSPLTEHPIFLYLIAAGTAKGTHQQSDAITS